MLPVEKVVAKLLGMPVVDAAKRARVSFVSVQPVRPGGDAYQLRLQQSGEIDRPAMDAFAASVPAGSVILIARHGQREVEYKF